MSFSKLLRFARYCKDIYNRQLLVSNTISTIALLAAGDIMTQYIEVKLKNDSLRLKLTASDSLTSKIRSSTDDKTKTGDDKAEGDKKSLVPQNQPTMQSFYSYYDWFRSAKLAAIGLVSGPFGHYWYNYLDHRFKTRTTKDVLMKILYDQAIGAPIFNVLFIYGTHTLDGKHISHITEIFKEKFLTIYAYDCTIWPLAQFINFCFIPTIYRLLYVNLISLIWNAVLSYILFDEVD